MLLFICGILYLTNSLKFTFSRLLTNNCFPHVNTLEQIHSRQECLKSATIIITGQHICELQWPILRHIPNLSYIYCHQWNRTLLCYSVTCINKPHIIYGIIVIQSKLILLTCNKLVTSLKYLLSIALACVHVTLLKLPILIIPFTCVSSSWKYCAIM